MIIKKHFSKISMYALLLIICLCACDDDEETICYAEDGNGNY